MARSVVSRRRRRASLGQRSESRAARGEAAPSAHDVVARAEAHRHVVDAVLALDEPYRTVILLRYFDGRKTGAIARALGCPVATVRTRLVRGIERLRAALEPRVGPSSAWPALFGLALGPSAGVAAASSSVAAGAPGSLTLSTGTLWMSTQTKVLFAVAAALAVGVSALFWQGETPAAETIAEPGAAAVASVHETTATVPPEPTAAAATRSAAAPRPRVEVTTPAVPASVIPDLPGDGLLVYVHDADGDPVANARVWQTQSPLVLTRILTPEDTPEKRAAKRRFAVAGALEDAPAPDPGDTPATPPTPPPQTSEPLLEARGPHLLASTDARGVCRVPATGDGRLIATDDEGNVSGYADVASGSPVVLCVEAGYLIGGRVLDPKRKPAGNATVHLAAVGRHLVGRSLPCTTQIATDARGLFACVLPKAPIDIALVASRDDLRSEFVFLYARTRELELDLQAQGIVHGQVLDPFGAPCADAVVTACPFHVLPDQQWMFEFLGQATTDRNGVYRLLVPEQATLLVRATHPQWAPSEAQAAVVAPGQTVGTDLRLEQWAQLTVEARRADGRPLQGAVVEVTPESADTREGPAPRATTGETDEHGLCELRRLPSQTMFKIVCTPDRQRPWLRSERQGVASGVQTFVFDPAVFEGSAIALVVRETDGTAFEGAAEVTLRAPTGRGQLTCAVTCDADGHATVSGLQPGTHFSLTLAVPGRAHAFLPRATAGTKEPLELHLEPGYDLRVVVRDRKGRAAPGATVAVDAKHRDAATTTTRTDARGVATFPALPAGKYTVSAERGGRKERGTITLGAGADDTIALRL